MVSEALDPKALEAGDDLCPVCAVPFKTGDTCATDIELGSCHAECLEGSPVVDLDTGDPSDGPITTYAYEPLPALAAEQAAPVAVEPVRGAYTQEMTDEFTDAQFATPPAAQVAELERERDEALAEVAVWDDKFVNRVVAEHGTTIDILVKRLDEYAVRIHAAEARATAAEAQAAKIEAETIERCAQLAYVTCAETRHVTLGDACATAIRTLASPAQEPQDAK